MALGERFELLAHEVDVALAEKAFLQSTGPHLVIEQNVSQNKIDEIVGAALEHRGRLYHLKLSPAGLVVFQALAQTRWPKNATQLSRDIQAGNFRKTLARGSRARTVHRSHIKMYVNRIKRALGDALQEAGLNIPSSSVLVSHRAEGFVGYRLKAAVSWIHGQTS